VTAQAQRMLLPRVLWLQYGVPLLLTVIVHLIAAVALMEGWSSVKEPERVLFRESISARLLTIEAAAPEPAPVTQPPRQAEEKPRPAPAEQRPLPTEAAPARPEPEVARITTPDIEPRPAPEPEPEPDRRWQEEQQEVFSRALDAEAERMAATQAEAASASYIGAIIRQIERHWSRPPSARPGMQVELLMSLVPTGELVDISVVRSSGNAAFDRSAELAVSQAAPFEVPDNPALFEQRFRRLRLLFTPEDLRNR